MKRLGTVLLLVIFALGCGGSNDNKENNSDNEDATASNSKPPTRKGAGAESGGGSGPRRSGIFSAGNEMADLNVFKMVALSLHNAHDVFRKFPLHPGPVNRNEKLSWRAHVVPFMGNSSVQFKIDEPWDSPANKPLASKVKDFNLSTGNLISAIVFEGSPVKMREIIDGTSNTVMLLENPNASGSDWTQPKDLTAEEATKLIMGLEEGEYLMAAFYDGAAMRLYSPKGKKITEQEVSNYFTHNDGIPMNDALLQK